MTEAVDPAPVEEWLRLDNGGVATIPWPEVGPEEFGSWVHTLQRGERLWATCLAEGGIQVIIALAEGTERCGHTAPEMFLTCILPPGHEGPHWGQTKESRQQIEIMARKMAMGPNGMMERIVSFWEEEGLLPDL